MTDAKFQMTNPIQRKFREAQQANEYTATNHYGKAYCFMCDTIDEDSIARLMNICHDCIRKRGLELMLRKVKTEYYGLCYKCGHYKFTVHYVNVRVCQKCQVRISNVLAEYKKAGGMLKADPFWQYMHKRHRHEYPQIFGRRI